MALRERIRGLGDVLWLARQRIGAKDRFARDTAGYGLLQRFARWAVPDYVVTDPDKAWYRDRAFLSDLRRVLPDGNQRSADRKYLLRSLLYLADATPGDTAECGVWTGSSSWFICRHFDGTGKVHHGFDSFEGLSEPAAEDGLYWHRGDLGEGEDAARAMLEGFDVRLYRGWIPERFDEVADRSFSFVHIDVDLFEPTRDSIAFFYPRMAPGGVMLFDDYGFVTCPGATRAVDDYMAERPEPIVHVPTGQAFLIKGA